MAEKQVRSPICSVLGHVDHGKSSILDAIRGTAIIAGEAGGITQAIGASIIPMETIQDICGSLLEQLKLDITLPGLLFIDTPGHAAFTSLRKRGGNLADIAIVVVDINEGFKPQTMEAIEILKSYKTPFVIAANKVDLVNGWKSLDKPLIPSLNAQDPQVKAEVETKVYNVVGQLHEEFSLQSEHFFRVQDYTKQIAIVPCSAKTGEGIPELLMVMTGMAQKYLEEGLKADIEGPAKGTIIEVKEEQGLGTTLDVIIYDGTLKVNDTIVLGALPEPIVTKVRALFEPAPLAEMRDKKSDFVSVKEIKAATGVKVAAPHLGDAMSGMPLRACSVDEVDGIKEGIMADIDEVLIETDEEGIVIKADTLGSLEALEKLLREEGIPIRRASVGNISKKDVVDAESNYESDPLSAVILGFNVKATDEIRNQSERVTIFTHAVVYQLIEDYQRWKEDELKAMEAQSLDKLTRPCKIQLIPGYVFRQSNPAICGCEIMAGTLTTGMSMMREDKNIVASVKAIQDEGKNISRAEQSKKVAVSLEGLQIGRQAGEGDVLYSAIPEDEFRELKRYKQYLTEGEKQTAREIADIMRKDNPVWGI